MIEFTKAEVGVIQTIISLLDDQPWCWQEGLDPSEEKLWRKSLYEKIYGEPYEEE